MKCTAQVGMYTRPCLQLVRLQRANNLLSSQHPYIHCNVKKFSYNEHPFARCNRNPLYRTIITAHKQSYGKVKLSQESVCSRGGGSHCNHYPWCIEPDRYLPPGKIRWGIPPPPRQCWSSETCSNLFIWGPARATSGGQHWNVQFPSGQVLLECFLVFLPPTN